MDWIAEVLALLKSLLTLGSSPGGQNVIARVLPEQRKQLDAEIAALKDAPDPKE